MKYMPLKDKLIVAAAFLMIIAALALGTYQVYWIHANYGWHGLMYWLVNGRTPLEVGR